MEPKPITLQKPFVVPFELLIYTIIFTIPLVLSGPQWITGTLVNYLLLMYAITFPKKNIILIAVLPSIAALGNSILFGLLTPFLLYFLPFIWIGNIVLMKFVRYCYPRKCLTRALFLSAATKSIIIFSAAAIYFHFEIVPRIFLYSMGIMQLYTAFAGGLLTFITLKILKKKYA